MSQRTYHIYGIGNALVDVEYRVKDSFLDQRDLEKRRMKLVDSAEILSLIDALGSEPVSQNCGGSVANTLYAMSGFGFSGYMSCRVAADAAGRYFTSELRQAGVQTNEIADDPNEVTGRCLILITPDAERTMNTCLGISNLLSVNQLNEAALKDSSNLYIEGYLASSPTGTEAAKQAKEIADMHQVSTNLTLSDTSMVHAFRSSLEGMMGNGITRIFSNVDEAMAWCNTDRLDICLNELSDIATEVVVTLGEKGCAIKFKDQKFESPGVPIDPIDSNGAGDMFAAAYLSAIGTSGDEDRKSAAQFANYAAASLIMVDGARFNTLQHYADIKQAFRGSGQKVSASGK